MPQQTKLYHIEPDDNNAGKFRLIRIDCQGYPEDEPAHIEVVSNLDQLEAALLVRYANLGYYRDTQERQVETPELKPGPVVQTSSLAEQSLLVDPEEELLYLNFYREGLSFSIPILARKKDAIRSRWPEFRRYVEEILELKSFHSLTQRNK